jgi:hypothetical protein
MRIDYTCHNEECQHDFRVDYAAADKWTEAEISPGECPKCNTEVDFEEVENDALPDPDYYDEPER